MARRNEQDMIEEHKQSYCFEKQHYKKLHF